MKCEWPLLRSLWAHFIKQVNWCVCILIPLDRIRFSLTFRWWNFPLLYSFWCIRVCTVQSSAASSLSPFSIQNSMPLTTVSINKCWKDEVSMTSVASSSFSCVMYVMLTVKTIFSWDEFNEKIRIENMKRERDRWEWDDGNGIPVISIAFKNSNKMNFSSNIVKVQKSLFQKRKCLVDGFHFPFLISVSHVIVFISNYLKCGFVSIRSTCGIFRHQYTKH